MFVIHKNSPIHTEGISFGHDENRRMIQAFSDLWMSLLEMRSFYIEKIMR